MRFRAWAQNGRYQNRHPAKTVDRRVTVNNLGGLFANWESRRPRCDGVHLSTATHADIVQALRDSGCVFADEEGRIAYHRCENLALADRNGEPSPGRDPAQARDGVDRVLRLPHCRGIRDLYPRSPYRILGAASAQGFAVTEEPHRYLMVGVGIRGSQPHQTTRPMRTPCGATGGDGRDGSKADLKVNKKRAPMELSRGVIPNASKTAELCGLSSTHICDVP